MSEAKPIPPCLAEVFRKIDGRPLGTVDSDLTQTLANMALHNVGVSRYVFTCPRQVCCGIGRMLVFPHYEVDEWPDCSADGAAT